MKNPFVIALLTALGAGLVVGGLLYDSRSADNDLGLNMDLSEIERRVEPPISKGQTARPAAVAGDFYPDDASILVSDIEGYLQAADIGQSVGQPRLVVSPHAAYRYSGALAGQAIKPLQGQPYERVVLIGRSHKQQYHGVAADPNHVWQTPLGDIRLDQVFIGRLLEESGGTVVLDAAPHKEEHSLEVLVPIIQQALGAETSIVPLLLGDDTPELTASLARALRRLMDEKTAIVISTDLSHYPDTEDAAEVDKLTVEAMMSGDLLQWREQVSQAEKGQTEGLETAACGAAAVDVGLQLARYFGWQPRLLGYANSGQLDPETADRSVGYAAVVFEGGLPLTTGEELNQAEGAEAVNLARRAIDAYLSGQDAVVPTLPTEPIFDERRGAFVTLKRHEELRGCIGSLEPQASLDRVLQSVAVSAASEDHRFKPVTAEEMAELDIEVSVLTPAVPVSSADEIVLGTDGVWLEQGSSRGVFLPQVAEETGWTKEEFLSQLCSQKAGLPADCWQDEKTKLSVFTAQVFSEPYRTETNAHDPADHDHGDGQDHGHVH